MAVVKELHLGKNIDDLEKYYSLPDVKTKKITMLISTARKLYQKAEKSCLEGDEEWGYVYYMKYFNLIDCIRKKPDYGQNKQFVRQMLGGNATHTTAMFKVETLNNSLSKRYRRLAENAIMDINPLLDANSNEKDFSQNTQYDILPTFIVAENDHGKSVSLMKCEELFRNIQNKSSILIMDCRSKKDFEISHLHYAWSMNVPEEYIMTGMSAGKVQDKLDSNAKALWSSRSIKDQVILMDWNCRDANPAPNSPISILRDILQMWDPDVTYRSPIKILKGGYEYFILMYPTLCTNPSVQAPYSNKSEVEYIEDIEYPSIHDITMKDDIRERVDSTIPPLSQLGGNEDTSVIRPSVDRSSKLAAIKTYDEKQKPIVEIIKEQEILMEKAQENDEQLLRAEHDWKKVIDQKENTKAEEQKSDLIRVEQELIYNIMQLESTAADYKLENNRLRDELEEYKRREKEQQLGDKLSPKDVENLEKATKKIETKIQERQKLDEQHERDKQIREKQLAIAREQKRHMKPPAYEDEEMSKPKIPQFDRSIKPTQQMTNFIEQDRQRDFLPTPGAVGRGLTGLKNLGNTCYMNSILQCLSNTQPLTEYCITNKYKSYISRSNKTKGHIVEEVAALIKVLWNGNYKCVASKDLRYVIGQYQQIFRGIEQQDSHEFLTILMDWLHSDLQTLPVRDKPRENMPASEKAWLEFTKDRESLILRLFYGQIKSTVKCAECEKESATYECFSNLSLELPSSANMCSLNQCMDMYFSGERIHGWNCPNCKQKRDAIKKLNISKLPPILVVHLKRFYADTDAIGHSYKKNSNYVRFPLENLDMTPYIAKSGLRSMSPKTYQLYGVSNHYGSMEGGHYTAFCKSGVFDRWFKFDDQVVTQLDTSSVVSSAAYILFYTWLPQIPPPEIN